MVAMAQLIDTPKNPEVVDDQDPFACDPNATTDNSDEAIEEFSFNFGFGELEPEFPEIQRDLSSEAIVSALAQDVRGQEKAIATVAESLAAPLAGLKIRPERPHAVFFFAGPTGVGKTQLAKSLARVVYGTDRALIRLDMSEYADGQDARMKLIGGSRIWKNSSTEGLLTTRVRRKPLNVLLLDEFEKSDPSIWPLFLQIFDEGILTDGWGKTAHFDESIIVMTSNLGAEEATAPQVGFGATDGEVSFDAERQLGVIAKALPPEFIGRMSATVVFDPLDRYAIREIARKEVSGLTERLDERGWHILCDENVPAWIADVDYDPAHGARYLQRTIERHLLRPLAKIHSRNARVSVADDGRWLEVSEAA